ncbi:ATP-binding protein [Actinomadura viridis]|uniref:ATP-binding protein n=1 Tax=Actinomadura viridis TaxID=58110 RepID=A0A931DLN9_9ACTN|nr:ATP-binding protein [Actinomadura viridis]MBG6093509.1 hypothetical protein [Actinomadura viridis]
MVGSAGQREHAVQSTPVPESCGLPPRLDQALRALVDLTAPTVSFTVLPDPESVTEARHFAVSRLDGWGTGALADDVGLVVSELVTNALRHSGGPAFHRADPRGPVLRGGHAFRGGCEDGSADPLGSAPAAIRLRLLYKAPWLLCGIMDASRSAPRRKEPDYIAETGRGLHLVESFSIRWGWCGLPQGKVVWALFRTP